MRPTFPAAILISIILINFAEALAEGKDNNTKHHHHHHHHHHDQDFDLVIFAQSWPTTNCMEWKERDVHNKCNLPKNTWTVHGIWPTKNHEIGPNYCHEVKFDPTALKPILKTLEEHWTNIHANANEDSFWAHEWKKHGSCASNITNLNSELKYFTQGVRWNILYPLFKYLSDAKIIPGKSYSFDQYFEAVRSKIGGHHPSVQCLYDHELHENVISQINICFDKNLKVTDCDKIKGGLDHNCPTHHGAKIFYPEKVHRNMDRIYTIIGCSALVFLCTMIPFMFIMEKYCLRTRDGTQPLIQPQRDFENIH